MAMYNFEFPFCEVIFCGVPLCVFDKLWCTTSEKRLWNTALDEKRLWSMMLINLQNLHPSGSFILFTSLVNVSTHSRVFLLRKVIVTAKYFLWDGKGYYHNHNSLPQDPILNLMCVCSPHPLTKFQV